MWIIEIFDNNSKSIANQYWFRDDEHNLEFSIGRTNENRISFPDDKSISRTHAIIKCQISTDGQSGLFITDLGSKYGTTMNKTKVIANENIQIPESGATVKFGPVSSKIIVSKKQYRFCTSRLDKLHREQFHRCMTLVDATMVNNVEQATHLVMNEYTATLKSLTAVIMKVPIVKSSWLDFAESSKSDPLIEIPPCSRYFPELTSSTRLDIESSRSKLLENFSILILFEADTQYMNIMELCGAKVVNLVDTQTIDMTKLGINTDNEASKVCAFVDEGSPQRRELPASSIRVSWLTRKCLADAIISMLQPILFDDIRDVKMTASQRQSQFISQPIVPSTAPKPPTNNTDKRMDLISSTTTESKPLTAADKTSTTKAKNADIFDVDQNFLSSRPVSMDDDAMIDVSSKPNKRSRDDAWQSNGNSSAMKPTSSSSSSSSDKHQHTIKRSKLEDDASTYNLTPYDNDDLQQQSSSSAPLPSYPPSAVLAMKSTRQPQIMASSNWISFVRGSDRVEQVERKRKLYESSAINQPIPSSTPSASVKAAIFNDDDDDRSQQTMIYSQPVVVERDLIKRLTQDSMYYSSYTPIESRSASAPDMMTSTYGSKDVRRFRKNPIRKRRLTNMLKSSAMEKVLPKESERELELRREMDVEENEERATEQLFSERLLGKAKNDRRK